MDTSTPAAIKVQGLDISGMFWGAIRRPVLDMLNKQGWFHWPYWHEAGIVLLCLIGLYTLIWFYSNWLR
jgi:hypothetical protein